MKADHRNLLVCKQAQVQELLSSSRGSAVKQCSCRHSAWDRSDRTVRVTRLSLLAPLLVEIIAVLGVFTTAFYQSPGSMCRPHCLSPVLWLCKCRWSQKNANVGERKVQGGEVGLILQGFLCCLYSIWKQLFVITFSKQQKELTQVQNSLWDLSAAGQTSSFQKSQTRLAGTVWLKSSWKDYVHLSRKAEMARLLPPSMGFPHVLCGTVPDGSKGCSQICPAAVNTCWYLESCKSGLCWFGPTYLMVLGFDVEGTG